MWNGTYSLSIYIYSVLKGIGCFGNYISLTMAYKALILVVIIIREGVLMETFIWKYYILSVFIYVLVFDIKMIHT